MNLGLEVWGLRLWILDGLLPRGATWFGQVISSLPGPGGGPFMTHLLPGGRVARVHWARTPVPPCLPHFATPRSVCYLACRQAITHYIALLELMLGCLGCRRCRARATGLLPVVPTDMGWRGGCLAAELVHDALHHNFLGGCSALLVCSWRSRQVREAGPVAPLVLFPPPPPPLVQVAGCPLRVFFVHACWYAISCAFRELGPVALPVRAACPLRGCALALPRCQPPPPPFLRTHLARSTRRVPVGPFHVVRAPPRFPLGSLAPPAKRGEGMARSPCSSSCLWGVCFHWGGSVWLGPSGGAWWGEGEGGDVVLRW